MEYIQSMGYPTPVIHGMWEEHEMTFVVLPAEDDSVVELRHTELNGRFQVVPTGEKPIVQGTPGKPLCFSYAVSEGVPSYIVVCRKANGKESTWVPQFSGRDGSLMTDSDFIDGEPKG